MAASKKQKRVKANSPPKRGRIPKEKPPQIPEGIRFSFKYYESNPPFDAAPYDGFFDVLLDRLKSLGGMRMPDMMGDMSKALRAHPVDWAYTGQPEGFTHLNQQLRDLPAHQFSLGRNKGRVFGFVQGSVFYVCWLDPNHKVYPEG